MDTRLRQDMNYELIECCTYIRSIKSGDLSEFLINPRSDNIPKVSKKIFYSHYLKYHENKKPLSEIPFKKKIPFYIVSCILLLSYAIFQSSRIFLHSVIFTALAALKIFSSQKWIEETKSQQCFHIKSIYLFTKFAFSFAYAHRVVFYANPVLNLSSAAANMLEFERNELKCILDKYSKKEPSNDVKNVLIDLIATLYGPLEKLIQKEYPQDFELEKCFNELEVLYTALPQENQQHLLNSANLNYITYTHSIHHDRLNGQLKKSEEYWDREWIIKSPNQDCYYGRDVLPLWLIKKMESQPTGDYHYPEHLYRYIWERWSDSKDEKTTTKIITFLAEHPHRIQNICLASLQKTCLGHIETNKELKPSANPDMSFLDKVINAAKISVLVQWMAVYVPPRWDLSNDLDYRKNGGIAYFNPTEIAENRLTILNSHLSKGDENEKESTEIALQDFYKSTKTAKDNDERNDYIEQIDFKAEGGEWMSTKLVDKYRIETAIFLFNRFKNNTPDFIPFFSQKERQKLVTFVLSCKVTKLKIPKFIIFLILQRTYKENLFLDIYNKAPKVFVNDI